MRRILAKAYAAAYAAQLLVSWAAYGSYVPARAAQPRQAVFATARDASSLSCVSGALQACKTKRRRVRARWEKRLAVLSRRQVPLSEQPVRTRPAVPAPPALPDPFPPDHPPA